MPRISESCLRQQDSTVRGREQNQIYFVGLRIGRSEADVKTKDCARSIIPLKLTTDTQLGGLSATAELVCVQQRRRYCFCPCSFVCLSVSKITQIACMDLDEMLHVDRCRDMDELINF